MQVQFTVNMCCFDGSRSGNYFEGESVSKTEVKGRAKSSTTVRKQQRFSNSSMDMEGGEI